MNRKSLLGWGLLIGALLALILIPFVLYEDPINAALKAFIDAGHPPEEVASAIVALMALDVFLPIPSSLVGTTSGALLGLVNGTLAAWLGLTAGCLLAYAFGALAGRPAVARLAGPGELSRTESAAECHGEWIIVLFRAVPVLAESSVIWAGASRMAPRRFLLMSGLANLGIAAVYAGIGALARDMEGFIYAFFAALLLPGAAMLMARGGRIRRS